MKFPAKSGPEFQLEGIKGYASTSASGLKSIDASYLIIDGRRPLTKTTVSDRIFFVHSGDGTFTIAGKAIPVTTGDFVVIPKNSPFEYLGTMILVEFAAPAFDPDGEQELEKS